MTPPQSPSVIGIETAVTDYIYDETKANTALSDEFLKTLRDPAPREGENILVSAEMFDAKLLEFAQAKNLTATGETDRQKAESVPALFRAWKSNANA